MKVLYFDKPMRLQDQLTLKIYSLGQVAYRGHLKTIIDRIGIGEKYKNWVSSNLDQYKLSILGTKAVFHVDHNSELFHLTTMAETEKVVIKNVLNSIKSGDVFYDVGGHIGIYSCLVAKKGAQVIAFEPYPGNVERIEKNARENQVPVDVYEYALSDSNGKASLYVDSESEVSGGKGSIHGDGNKTISVETRTIDSLSKQSNIPSPNVIKIDVEGAELNVLQGMEDTLENPDCRRLYIEVHRWIVEKKKVIQKLESHGFTCTILDVENRDYVLATKD